MTIPSSYSTEGITHYTIPSFKFESGDVQTIHVAYRSINPSSSRKALVPTCYGSLINLEQAFTTGALSSYHVVVVAMLGNGESSSPSNTPDFPALLDYRDCIRAQHALLTQHLGFSTLDVVVGHSMGGQQAYYWACMFPSFVKAAVVICSSAKTSAHNQAFLAGPEAALVNSIDYDDGRWKTAAERKLPLRGLRAFARAWCAWAFSPAWFRAGHWKQSADSMDEWLKKEGETSFEESDPDDLLVLMSMWRRGDIGVFDEAGSYERMLEKLQIPILLLPSRTDAYFP